MNKKAQIFIDSKPAALLSYNEVEKWTLEYLEEYQILERPISLLLPLTSDRRIYKSEKLFSYFEGLFVEGWLKRLADRELPYSDLVDNLIRRCSHSVGDVELASIDSKAVPMDRSHQLSAYTPTEHLPHVSDRCLYCFESLGEPGENRNYHSACSKELFGREIPPRFDFTREELPSVALKSISSGISLPGIQQKVSLAYGYSGLQFIVKPEVEGVRDVPQIECLWMKMASHLGLVAAYAGLCYLQDGTLAYITQRFDRTRQGKIHVEDFSQLLGRTTYEDDKFNGSYNDIVSVIRKYAKYRTSSVVLRFYRLCLFNLIFGNNDAHLKNFALINIPSGKPGSKYITTLAPAYDLVPVRFLDHKSQSIDMALDHIAGGRRQDIGRRQLDEMCLSFGLKIDATDQFFTDLLARKEGLVHIFRQSLVDSNIKKALVQKINKRVRALGIKMDLL